MKAIHNRKGGFHIVHIVISGTFVDSFGKGMGRWW